MTSDSENTTTSTGPGPLTRWAPILIVFAALAGYLIITRPVGALQGWSEDYNAALQQAREADRNLLLYFHTDFCAPCSAMERSVLGEAEVVVALKDFITVRLDANRRSDIAGRFGVYGTPTFVIATSSEEVLAQSAGYRGPPEFISFLELASVKQPPSQDEPGALFPSDDP